LNKKRQQYAIYVDRPTLQYATKMLMRCRVRLQLTCEVVMLYLRLS